MVARLRSWWQSKNKPILIAIIIIYLIGFIAVIILGSTFNWEWTGLSGYYKETIATTTSITATKSITRTVEYQPPKTLWDWMNLIFLGFITILAAYFTSILSNRQKETELAIASDKQCEEALQAYIDKISELLLEKNLRESKPEDEVRKVARVRTLTVLPHLDKERKRSVLQFLYESGLISKDKHIIDLSSADFKEANLRWIHLENADLRGTLLTDGVDLRDAHLDGADLRGAFFRGADLSSASLRGANLCETRLNNTKLVKTDLSEAHLRATRFQHANLSEAQVTPDQLNTALSFEGAIMPDGSKHP